MNLSFSQFSWVCKNSLIVETGREIHKYGDTEIIETAKSTQENRWNHEVEIKDKSMGCMKCVALRKNPDF